MRLEGLNFKGISFDNQPLPGGVRSGKSGQGLAFTLALWRERAKQRAELAQLDEASRRDIGVTQADVWRETRKAPWQS